MELVTIAEFDDSTKAHFARMQLEMEEIDAFLADLETISMDWLLGRAVGLIKLQVRDEDVERALDILSVRQKAAPDGDKGVRETISTRMIFWAILAAIAVILLIASTRFDSISGRS